MKISQYIPSVRLTPERLTDLLDRLDEAGTRDALRDLSPCSQFRVTDLRAIIIQPGGGAAHFHLCTRQVAPTGLSFVHSGYLHPGTRVALDARPGEKGRSVSAKVGSCVHVERSIHCVTLLFDQQVDPAVFLQRTTSTPAVAATAPQAQKPERTAPPSPPPETPEPDDQGPIYTTLETTTAVERVVNSFVRRVQGCAEELDAAAKVNDRPRILETCATLARNAPGCGFDRLARAASLAAAAVAGTTGAPDKISALADLIALCARVAPRPRQAA
ncbi:MAG: hypothetical protein SFZ24_07280 [Planctomycetota bacterium]|nr:hypothetical protein [Planctomycetota bacterium]